MPLVTCDYSRGFLLRRMPLVTCDYSRGFLLRRMPLVTCDYSRIRLRRITSTSETQLQSSKLDAIVFLRILHSSQLVTHRKIQLVFCILEGCCDVSAADDVLDCCCHVLAACVVVVALFYDLCM